MNKSIILSAQTHPVIKQFLTRKVLEWGVSIGGALLLVWFHNFSSLTSTLALLGLVITIPVLFNKPEYVAYSLAVLLPFREIHIVSVIFLHRVVIWGFLLWMMIRQLVNNDVFFSHNLAKFTRYMVYFLAAMGISLLLVTSKFYSTSYITRVISCPTLIRGSHQIS